MSGVPAPALSAVVPPPAPVPVVPVAPIPVVPVAAVTPRTSDLAGIKTYLGPHVVSADYVNAEDWLVHFQSITDANWSTDGLRIQAFAQKLGGSAAQWFRYTLTNTEKQLWALTKVAFLKYARPTDVITSYVAKFQARVQEPNEHVLEYYIALKHLQTMQFQTAYAMAPAAIIAAVRAVEAAESVAMNNLRTNFTAATQAVAVQAEATTKAVKESISQVITDDQVRTRFRNNCYKEITAELQFDYDPYNTKTVNELLDKAKMIEAKLVVQSKLHFQDKLQADGGDAKKVLATPHTSDDQVKSQYNHNGSNHNNNKRKNNGADGEEKQPKKYYTPEQKAKYKAAQEHIRLLREEAKGTPNEGTTTSTTSTTQQTTPQQGGASRGKRYRPINEVRCYNCQQLGHYADVCSNARVPRAPRTQPSMKSEEQSNYISQMENTETIKMYHDMDEVEVENPIRGYKYYAPSEVEDTELLSMIQMRNKKVDKGKNYSVLPVTVTGIIGEQVFIGSVVIDSGSTTSCISLDFVERNLVGPMKDKMSYILNKELELLGPGGEKLQQMGTIMLPLALGTPENNSPLSYAVRFRVIKYLGCRMILGLDYMDGLVDSISIKKKVVVLVDSRKATAVSWYRQPLKSTVQQGKPRATAVATTPAIVEPIASQSSATALRPPQSLSLVPYQSQPPVLTFPTRSRATLPSSISTPSSSPTEMTTAIPMDTSAGSSVATQLAEEEKKEEVVEQETVIRKRIPKRAGATTTVPEVQGTSKPTQDDASGGDKRATSSKSSKSKKKFKKGNVGEQRVTETTKAIFSVPIAKNNSNHSKTSPPPFINDQDHEIKYDEETMYPTNPPPNEPYALSNGTPLCREVKQKVSFERGMDESMEDVIDNESTGKLIDTRQTTIRIEAYNGSDIGNGSPRGEVWNVYLEKSLIIPPYTHIGVQCIRPITKRGKKRIIVCEETIGHDMLLEGNRSIDHGVFIANSLSKLGATNTRLTDVVNPSNKVIKLPVGMLLGRLEEFKPFDENEYYKLAGRGSELVLNNQPINIREKINFNGSILNPEQKEEITRLLEKYKDVFAAVSTAPPPSNIFHHHIDTQSAQPIKSGPARASFPEQQEIKKQINAMLKAGIITYSESPWASRVVMVKKKDGTLRFCVDYRRLNDETVKDSYPVPRPRDMFDAMEGSKYFSTLDLASGYWQIPLTEEAKKKTAFVTKDGLFEFTRMPFGLTNAPASFQRLMTMVLAKAYGIYALVYVDDTIIYSSTWTLHLSHIEQILTIFRKAKLVAKLEKCKFGRETVPFLGHIMSAQGIQVEPTKVNAMLQLKAPINVSEVRTVMGMFNYYRTFFPKFSDTAYPITQLLKKSVKFIWTQEHQTAFDILKYQLTQAPILRRPDYNKVFYLVTDASDIGLGAVLEQDSDLVEEVRHPIAYWSRTLQPREQKYTVTERECLAIVEAVKVFRHYIHGLHFKVITDHNALRWLDNAKDLNGRLTRWSLKLSEYDYEILYRKGKDNANADALSRMIEESKMQEVVGVIKEKQPTPKQGDESLSDINENEIRLRVGVEELDLEQAIKRNEIEFYQQTDDKYGPMVKYLATGIKPLGVSDEQFSTLIEQSHNYYLDPKDKLLKIKTEWKDPEKEDEVITYYRLVVPLALRQQYMRELHDSVFAGHLGRQRTIIKVTERYWWPNMIKEIKEWLLTCPECQQRRNPKNKPPLLPRPGVTANKPFQVVAVDIIGPLPQSTEGFKWILVFIDVFTKFAEAFPLRGIGGRTVAKVFIEQIVCRYGAPRALLSDLGRQFIGKIAQATYRLLTVKKLNTSGYHPQTNGLCERFNSTLKIMLRMYIDLDRQNWSKFIPYCVFAYNTSVQETTKHTPYYMVFGRGATLPIDVMTRTDDEVYTNEDEFIKKRIINMRQLINLQKQLIERFI